MGAGDVKLLAALGAWLGPAESVWLAMFSAAAGGVVGLAVALARGYLRTAFESLGDVDALAGAGSTAGARADPQRMERAPAGVRDSHHDRTGVHFMATLTTARVQGERGQAIVELALTLPLLMLVVLGVFDFGLMFERFEVVTNAAREGARVAVLPDYVPAQARAHALNYLAAGGITGTVVGTCAPAPGQICVSVVQDTATIPASGGNPAKTVAQMVVTAEYDHQHVFVGPIISLFGGSLGDHPPGGGQQNA